MRHITIIGAGLVGSLWAYILKKQNYDVTVFEKRQNPKDMHMQAGRSINLILTSRGLHGLEIAGLTKKILPLTTPVYGRGIHQKSGEKLFQPYGRNKTECNYSVSRWELNKALIAECQNIGVKFHFEENLEAIHLDNKQLTFSKNNHNQNINYDLLFATDGAGSVIRKALAAKEPQIYQERTDWLDSGYKELFMPKNSEMAKNELHIWARGTHMMMGLENIDSSYTMTLYLPHKNHEFSFEKIKTEADVKNMFESEFKSAIPFMPNYINDFMENPIGQLGTVRLSNWVYKGEIALMGDASHAIVPFFGQGMNSGFEDCTTLFKLLEKQKGSHFGEPKWEDILKSYNSIQRPNANAIADMALENFVEMRDKVADPQFQFKKKVESIIENEFPQWYRSRYGMITYTLIPYHVAQEAGLKQNQILDVLSTGLDDPKNVDLGKARLLLETEFYPWLNAQGFTTDRYLVQD